jgi:UDP-N-acetylmuramate dehydrogenase
MMAAKQETDRLLDRLPQVRGRTREGAALSQVTWFRVGGPAEVMFRPKDTEDLATFLRDKPQDIGVTVIGVGSNILVRDGGIPGVVIRLGREFAAISQNDHDIIAGAGALDTNVAKFAGANAIAGLEFMAGIPGTIGGALRMNAGAYGHEIKDVLIAADAVDGDGTIHTLTAADMGLTYRHVSVDEDWIFTSARFKGTPGDSKAIAEQITEIQKARAETQPVRTPTGGSTFKNPEGHKAWELIDQAGCRGLELGHARVSELHCNFLINEGDASAAEIEALGEEVRRRVKAKTGITLEWEIRILGIPSENGPKATPIERAQP